MPHRPTHILAIGILVPFLTFGCSNGSSSPTEPGPTTGSSGALSTDTVSDLARAIDDEYKARATYDAIMAEIGQVAPFVKIRNAENSHVRALVVLFDRYQLQIPSDPWTGNVEAPNTYQEACQAGVIAELENIAMYDEFFAFSGHPTDVLEVFTRLRAASLEAHLPAFERCS